MTDPVGKLEICGDLQHDPEGTGDPHVCRLPAGHDGYHDPMYDAPYCDSVWRDVTGVSRCWKPQNHEGRHSYDE